MVKNPYDIIKSRRITEKGNMLLHLKEAKSNRCVAKCRRPKYVFTVDKGANKVEIKRALEKIYADKNIKVVAVNTICCKPKSRRFRGYRGKMKGFKKAVITLREKDSIDGE